MFIKFFKLIFFVNVVTTIKATIFTSDVIERYIKVSYAECKERCEAYELCLSIKYYEKYKICELYETEQHGSLVGISVYTKPDNIRQLLEQECSGCKPPQECTLIGPERERSCSLKRCQSPTVVDGATVYGNKRSIGSKIKIRCDASLISVTSSCLEYGTWSSYDLECTCKPHDVEHGQVNLSVDQYGLVNADVLCDQGYSLFVQAYPVCNTTVDRWDGFHRVCCDIYQNGTWSKVWRFMSDAKDEVIDWWATLHDPPKRIMNNCIYRRIDIVTDWNGATLLNRVKLNVIKNEQIVAYILFDAYQSTNLDWFTKDRILESSWSDLNPGNNIEYFSLYGKAHYGSVVRFAIIKRLSGICEEDTGWLVITPAAYPCGSTKTTMHILYSPHSEHTHFTEGYIEYADRMEIWVEELLNK